MLKLDRWDCPDARGALQSFEETESQTGAPRTLRTGVYLGRGIPETYSSYLDSSVPGVTLGPCYLQIWIQQGKVGLRVCVSGEPQVAPRLLVPGLGKGRQSWRDPSWVPGCRCCVIIWLYLMGLCKKILLNLFLEK